MTIPPQQNSRQSAQPAHPAHGPAGTDETPWWTIPQQRQPSDAVPLRQVPRPRWPFVLVGVCVLLLGLFGVVVAATVGATSTSTEAQGADPSSQAAAPAYPAPSYSAPTYSAPPTTAAPAPEPAPQTVSGTGDEVVRLDSPRDIAVITFECRQCSSNVVVKADEDLLVNEIGRYSGTTMYGVSGTSTTAPLTRLQVNADAAWTMTIGGLDTARQVATAPVEGSGDEVVMIENPEDVATLTHDGESNFAVWAVSGTDSDLVVNEIGSYSGTVILPDDGGRMLVVVEADGNWSMR